MWQPVVDWILAHVGVQAVVIASVLLVVGKIIDLVLVLNPKAESNGLVHWLKLNLDSIIALFKK